VAVAAVEIAPFSGHERAFETVLHGYALHDLSSCCSVR
jgi:hypothetical protein